MRALHSFWVASLDASGVVLLGAIERMPPLGLMEAAAASTVVVALEGTTPGVALKVPFGEGVE